MSYAVIDIDATPQEAPALAEKVLARLLGDGLIVETPPESERAFMEFLRQHRGAADDLWWPGPAADASPSQRYLTVATTLTVEVMPLSLGDVGACPSGHESPLPGDWLDLASEVYEGRSDVPLACAPCGRTYPLREWNIEAFGIGSLIFSFIEWPVSASTLDVFREVLAPHRLRSILGKS